MDRLEQIEISRRARPIIRAATAHLLAYVQHNGSGSYQAYVPDIVKQHYSKDRDVGLITRAASTITSMTGATQFIETEGVADFVNMLSPASAGAVLLQRGWQFQFDGAGAIGVPGLLASSGNTSFVGEGLPIPVRQEVFTGLSLTPDKFATINVFTRDIFAHSIPTIEAMTTNVLRESVGLALDKALLDNVAADTTRPAGLLNGISGLTPSALTVKSESLQADVEQLVAQVSAVASNNPIIFICSPAQATALKMLPNFPFEVLSSSSLAAKTVICVASNCVASAIDPAPRFSMAKEATVHMETVPLAIGTAGSPPTVAAPTRSLFQTDSIGLRMIMEVSWGLRSATGLAWMVNVLW
jgi:hypothetical protein